jgi:hypothetical protein
MSGLSISRAASTSAGKCSSMAHCLPSGKHGGPPGGRSKLSEPSPKNSGILPTYADSIGVDAATGFLDGRSDRWEWRPR